MPAGTILMNRVLKAGALLMYHTKVFYALALLEDKARQRDSSIFSTSTLKAAATELGLAPQWGGYRFPYLHDKTQRGLRR